MSSGSHIAIIGGGPAGLFAAENLGQRGYRVSVFERMPTLGRKFLMAGRGGLNLTHSEPDQAFRTRYREAADWLAPVLDAFSPGDLRSWADGLGAETFVGSSGRVFPKAMKASPLLRAWRQRLDALGVEFHFRTRWTGWDEQSLRFQNDAGESVQIQCDAVILALGGASWPRLGSDASWTGMLQDKGVDLVPFQASNCGVEIGWSDVVRERFAGEPLKTIALSCGEERVAGEAMIAAYGLEGGAVYALSEPIRNALRLGACELRLDLRPNQTADQLAAKLERARKGQSLSTVLRKTLGLAPQAAALVRETGEVPREPKALAAHIKSIPLDVTAQRGLDRAISSAGGIARSAVDEQLMLKAIPGTFVAGEMLDWDAPTGGYLLQATFATGLAAAKGVEVWLNAEGR
ncbi:TIGR03862 family flavoprotein [Maricaulis sp.]|uniref:NAD(P)/FAD-dependent oxidoreductase n=1 Tax=Maricaulis sp. TaxID=1486257 RepID=UPI001B267170|nr:TIGR03862 family flavoprotein [Maricaulis sp.]MBO6797721.1 TIGR03862 family flavoprotein [Maricaulis sp.]